MVLIIISHKADKHSFPDISGHGATGPYPYSHISRSCLRHFGQKVMTFGKFSYWYSVPQNRHFLVMVMADPLFIWSGIYKQASCVFRLP